MIKKSYLIPEFYIHKIPYCDDCDEQLKDTGIALMSNPPQYQYICPKCNKTYTFNDKDIQGEWKWRTI